MEGDGFTDRGFRFCKGGAGCDAAGQVQNVGGEVRTCIFYDYGIAHRTTLVSPQTGLLEDTLESVRLQFVDALHLDGHGRFVRITSINVDESATIRARRSSMSRIFWPR